LPCVLPTYYDGVQQDWLFPRVHGKIESIQSQSMTKFQPNREKLVFVGSKLKREYEANIFCVVIWYMWDIGN